LIKKNYKKYLNFFYILADDDEQGDGDEEVFK